MKSFDQQGVCVRLVMTLLGLMLLLVYGVMMISHLWHLLEKSCLQNSVKIHVIVLKLLIILHYLYHILPSCHGNILQCIFQDCLS